MAEIKVKCHTDFEGYDKRQGPKVQYKCFEMLTVIVCIIYSWRCVVKRERTLNINKDKSQERWNKLNTSYASVAIRLQIHKNAHI